MTIEGNHITADEGKVLRRLSDKQVFSNELWLGKTFYINGKKLREPVEEKPEDYEDIEETTAIAEYQEMLSKRKAKIEMIAAYDLSSSVNGFTFNGIKMWLDKATRMSLRNSIEVTKASGGTSYAFWWDMEKYEIECDLFLEMLSALELYAIGCYATTERHKAEVNALCDLMDIEVYDITVGYPPQPVFTNDVKVRIQENQAEVEDQDASLL